MREATEFEVIIIGGSYAGLSAAMSLGRSRRKVLIIDGGKPCNRQTPHAHNFLTRDGESPAAIAQKAREQVLSYPTISLIRDEVVTGHAEGKGFRLLTRSDQAYTCKKIILATGIKDLMPDIKGFADCWGISVVHCPYCHGYESVDKKTAILANSDKAFHLLSLVYNLTKDLTLLTNGAAAFTPEQQAKIEAYKIPVIETAVAEIEHKEGQLRNLLFADGSSSPFETVYAALPYTQHTDIALSLGCELTANGHVKIDHVQLTSVKGVYACGDNAAMMRSLANAIATGNVAGAVVNAELIAERF